MPWKVTGHMDERKKFVRRILDGDQVAEVCREFGISRKTGYKILARFEARGLSGLEDQSRRPRRLANLLDTGMAELVLQMKAEKPTWEPRKFESYYSVSTRAFALRPSVLSMRFLIEVVWLNLGSVGTKFTRPQAPTCPILWSQTIFGVRISKVNSI